MEVFKKSAASFILASLMLCCIPSTDANAKYLCNLANLSTRQFIAAGLALLTPFLLLHKQDVLPDIIKDSTIFKTIIGTPEKDEKYEFIPGKDGDHFRVKKHEKQPGTGLLGKYDVYSKIYDKASKNLLTLLFIAGFFRIVGYDAASASH